MDVITWTMSGYKSLCIYLLKKDGFVSNIRDLLRGKSALILKFAIELKLT